VTNETCVDGSNLPADYYLRRWMTDPDAGGAQNICYYIRSACPGAAQSQLMLAKRGLSLRASGDVAQLRLAAVQYDLLRPSRCVLACSAIPWCGAVERLP
jgi:hypothetical protein